MSGETLDGENSVGNLCNVKRRVFLAEDHSLVREGLASLLEKTGEFDVVGQCGDGLEVVEQVEQTRPDVLVLDCQMPGLNGADICHELKQERSAVVILMLSMHADEDVIIRALEYGARGYLLKESAGTDLVEALNTVLAGMIYLGPGIDKSILAKLHKPRTDAYDTLTPRERQILQLIAESMTNPMIARKLELSVKTVDTHRMRLMKKLDIHDQTTLVRFYLARNGGMTT